MTQHLEPKAKMRTYKEQEQDKTRGKKKYRERLAQEREAEQEIRDFDLESPIPENLEEGPKQ